MNNENTWATLQTSPGARRGKESSPSMNTVSQPHHSCAVCGTTEKPLKYSTKHKFFWCQPCKMRSLRNKTEFLTLTLQEPIPTTYLIYALLDPRDQVTRYIGMSKQPEIRLIEHGRSKAHCRKYAWIQELQQQGLKPTLKIIEDVGGDKHYAFKRETYWIRYFLSRDTPLFNTYPLKKRA